MCGFAGIYDIRLQGAHSILDEVASSMTETLRHRGPDDGGVWVDEAAGIALGHRRLAIIDLTSEGHQPMHSANDRYVVVFNGEIYNYKEIRKELYKHGIKFRGRSDTEVLLEAIDQWGITNALSKFNGMFAFALWDKEKRYLYLARDRLGEKPLFYGVMGSCVIFGSELKALRAYKGFQLEIDRSTVWAYLQLNYIPAPRSIYKNIRKLPQATLAVIKRGFTLDDIENNLVRYWGLDTVINNVQGRKYSGSNEEAEEIINELLSDAVRLRMISDVSLGAFLSGGVDSSAIVALMQQHSTKPVKTFTIGFKEKGFDEAVYAKKISEHLGTEHTELYVNTKQAMDVIPMLADMYDEPYADSSSIPTFLVSKLARDNVTVALSGDGGDETFGGYNRYLWGRRIWGAIGWMPEICRALLSRSILSIPQNILYQMEKSISPLLPAKWKQPRFADQLHKLAWVINASDPYSLYFNMIVNWRDEENIVLQSNAIFDGVHGGFPKINHSNYTEWMMYVDTLSYLPDDILVKVDRASMAVGLEARAPYLDHRLIEFMWSLPTTMKINKSSSKLMLRRVLDRYVPRKYFQRPKMGFGVPIGRWLTTDLRDWAEELLSVNRLKAQGFFEPDVIRKKWNEHLSGKRRWAYELWTVLMFQAWYAHASESD